MEKKEISGIIAKIVLMGTNNFLSHDQVQLSLR